MTTLKEAREQGKLAEFIAEREAEQAPDGDEAAFNRALVSMARTSKEAPAASKPERADD
ncbi:MAG: hypothetical protein JWN21_2226 [Sphingomonas bacterium]|uniref:hypothetical protein n=1 Tax=Sphingomonas bacterium TaxID=1895847 RepID=UPI002616EB18|nr:hypothetical protein [Sphingomonas bacterium]MDB5696683.1 hypothetical protein [Sphingomonas bacterium]